ncbi:stage VI sporulation protein D [Salibacterium sp. K-3]
MAEAHSSALTFSLEESVWLNQGEKIKELVSLGLDPDIRIEEKIDYVDIKGGLYLKGEYHPETEEQNEQDDIDPVPRYIEKNMLREDGVGELQHFFPVDVTVPLNRIHHLDDIYVTIDSFDYDLPEPGCIQLTADISISGVKEDDRQEEPEPAVVEPMPRWETEETRAPEDEEMPEHKEEAEETFAVERFSDVSPSEEEESEEMEEPEEPTDIVTAFHGRDTEENSLPHVPEDADNEAGGEEVEEDSGSDESQKRSDKDDNALYLTKMMTKGEEDFSRLKMCIVQENESLDQIAERYETTTAQLLRFNRLEHDGVEEGQILYIPAPVSRTGPDDS